MPRGKGALKSATETTKYASANTDSSECTGLEMKDIEQTSTAAAHEDETGPSVDLVGEMSVDSNVQCEKTKEEDMLPRKPKRLFMITGSKKKDAKPRHSAAKTDENKAAKEETQTREGELADKTAQNKLDTDSYKEDSGKTDAKKDAPKRQFYDDDHPYEDPSLLVNNSTTLQNNTHDKPLSKAKTPPKKSVKMEQDQRPQSPGLKAGLSKSTESIKAAVKAVKAKHPSVMSEHSSARSVFAFLVALLLSLIIFLSFHFLLHSHAVLSIVVATLVYSIVFMALGFLDLRRIKCLVLLFLPSLCSRGGKVALYLLLLYFVIKGPLCNTIGNMKTVRRSIKCVNSIIADSDIADQTTFRTAQNCVSNFQRDSTNNRSVQTSFICLVKMCFSVKDKLKENCALKISRISPRACSLAEELSCNNSKISRETGDCPKETPCQKEFHEILALLDEDDTATDGCEFLEIIGMLLPLLILVLFYEAYNYEKSYRTYNNFHNYFLTGHFQCIDQSRSSCDREAVLPLRKVELRRHVRPATVCHLTDNEKKKLCRSLKTYVVFLLIVLFIILGDLYTFRMFNIERENRSNVSNRVDPKNTSKIFLRIKSNATTTNETTTNSTAPASKFIKLPDETGDNCSAMLESPGYVSKIVMPTLLTILLIVILLQAYFVRIQWFVCSRLYNNREKERVFYLYNKILEDRIQLVENCRKRMKCYHREMKTLNSLEPTRILAQQANWLSKVFKFFHINLRKCIICNDPEKPAFTICHGADCSGVYCLECSFDIDKKCLYCDTELKKSLSLKQPNEQDISSRESLV